MGCRPQTNRRSLGVSGDGLVNPRDRVALVPARSGSERVVDKNIKNLGGHPLMAYTIRVALDTGAFDRVYCVTDSAEYANIARYYGAEVPSLRPAEISASESPDIEWVNWFLSLKSVRDRNYSVFAILRPTSPFRAARYIIEAITHFEGNTVGFDSLRAVEETDVHPAKMWRISDDCLVPILPFSNGNVPWHSCQKKALPIVYKQNASLEVAWTKTVYRYKSISGARIQPWYSSGIDGFDINTHLDFEQAERMLESVLVSDSLLAMEPYKGYG